MAQCATCGGPLPLARRLRGSRECERCESVARASREAAAAEQDRAREAAHAEHRALVAGIVAGRPPDRVAVRRLAQVESSVWADPGAMATEKGRAFGAMIGQALADERLTADEERRLNEVGNALYQTDEAFMQAAAPYRSQIFIAVVNDGRLPEITSAHIIPKHAERVHFEGPAALLKEVIRREFQGGSRGVSLRIMKGVSYRVGAFRGKMVEVARSWEPADEGDLTVTSQRLVFTGARKTVEIPYPKLIGLDVFTDAIEVHASGRVNPPIFRVADGPMVAAVVNAAAQRIAG